MNDKRTQITISGIAHTSIERVWECWTKPEHITQWAFASDDWEAPSAENDLSVGGKFTTRMQAKDKSAGFDFGGTYTAITPHKLIAYDMDGDARHVENVFEETPDGVRITTTFDVENENPEEMQRSGWQSILDNFIRYTERGS